jgi:hypothetical protein
MPQENPPRQFKEVKSGLIAVLREGHEKLGEMAAENVKSWMEYRRNIYLATITLLTVVTPFANEYAQSLKLFWIGYIVLLASAIIGLITEEVRHWALQKIFEHGKRYMTGALDKLFESTSQTDLLEAQKLFQKSGAIPNYLEHIAKLCMLFSSLAVIAFLGGLASVGCSMVPSNAIY